jgi:hypothetical protein
MVPLAPATLLPLADEHGGAASALIAAGILGLVVLVLVAGVLVTLRQRRRVAPPVGGARPAAPLRVDLAPAALTVAREQAAADARFVPAVLEDAARRAARDHPGPAATRARVLAVDPAAQPPRAEVALLMADGATAQLPLVLNGPAQQPWRAAGPGLPGDRPAPDV